MREKSQLKSSAIKSLTVITAVIMIPFAVDILSNSSIVSKLTQIAAVQSASITFSGTIAANDTESSAVQGSVADTYQSQNVVKYNSQMIENMAVSNTSIWDIERAPEEDETPIAEEDLTEPLHQSEVEGALPYPAIMENNSGEIRRITYESYTGWQFLNLENGGQVRNSTSLSAETILAESRKMPEIVIENGDEPQVLIMHTHTTESYEPYARDFYDESFCSRTTDTTKNVVAIADAICAELDEAGIAYIHDTTVHDYPNYNGSYQRSRITAEEILAKYPSIKIVLDVHRDALVTSDGSRLAPIANINGKNAAQIMIISGVDDGTMDMPDYMMNFRLASLLQSTMETMYPGLTRPILFDYRHYNQDLTTGSLLLEMGSHANSLDEAIYAGELAGNALAEALKQLSE